MSVSRRQALGILALPLIVGCRNTFSPAVTRSRRPAFSEGEAGVIRLIGACDPHCDKSTLARVRVTSDMIKEALDADPTAWAFRGGDMTHRGSAEEHEAYWRPTWGRFPPEQALDTQGDHDRWNTVGAPAEHYYAYTGSPKFGAWNLGSYYRIYSLNCEGLDKGGVDHAQQLAWLKADLAEHSATRHILALTHKPLYVNLCDLHGDSSYPFRVRPMWQVLQQHGCELFLAGHAHRFETWKPKLSDGTVSENGIRQFVVGTGGVTLRTTSSHRNAAGQVVAGPHPDCEAVVTAHGVLRLDLHPDRFEWTFTDTTRAVRATGAQACRKIMVPPEQPSCSETS